MPATQAGADREPSVLTEVHGAVAVIRLNRPDRLNAIDGPMIADLRAAVAAANDAAEVRGIVLSGNGRCFMAGVDLSVFRERLHDAPAIALDLIDAFHVALREVRALKKPVIAAANGNIAGGGLSLLLACDFVVMAEDSTLVSGYSKLGTSPDGGATWSLTRAVGARRAFDVICLNDAIDATTALSLGLVNRVVPPVRLQEEALIYARRFAEGASLAVGLIKGLVETAGTLDLEQQLDRERSAFVECSSTADFREGVTAFFDKRPPRFGAEAGE